MHPPLKIMAHAAIGLAALALTSADASAQSVEPGITPASDVVAVAPDGIDAAVADLPDVIADIMTRSGVPGVAVAVVQQGETLFMEGYGIRKVGTAEQVTPQTVFQIASVSKSISATVAAIAISRGDVSWDDPVSLYLEDFTLSDPYIARHATIGDFFAHRSGLPDAAGDALEDLGFTRNQIIDRLAQVPLERFRTSYHYTNFGITIGAEAIAAATGLAWEELAERSLYEPLGMTATSSRYERFLTHDNRATLHTYENGTFEALYQRDPDAQSPAGGVSSNVEDLAKWLKLVLAQGRTREGNFFEPSSILPALQPQVVSARVADPAARSGFYGYGFNVAVTLGGRPAMNHSGAFVSGAATNFQILPSEELGIIVLSNGGPVGAVEAIAARFIDVVQFGAPTRGWFAAYHRVASGYYEPIGDLAGLQPPLSPEPSDAPHDYAGVYDNPYFGPARVEPSQSGLVLCLGPAGWRYDLQHWSGDIFAIAPRGENAPAGSLSSVRFSTTPQGKRMLVITYLNENGLGVWTSE